ncbi:MAG: hypothetical protein ACFCU6_02605, partial [Balneolaceae bacterium]
MFKKTGFILTILFAVTLIFSGVSCGDEKKDESEITERRTVPKLEMSAEAENLLFEPAEEPETGITESLYDEKVLAYRYINPGISISDILNFERGNQVRISLDQDLTISAEIQRKQEVLDIISITAKVLPPNEGQIVLSVENETIRGSITV